MLLFVLEGYKFLLSNTTGGMCMGPIGLTEEVCEGFR